MCNKKLLVPLFFLAIQGSLVTKKLTAAAESNNFSSMPFGMSGALGGDVTPPKSPITTTESWIAATSLLPKDLNDATKTIFLGEIQKWCLTNKVQFKIIHVETSNLRSSVQTFTPLLSEICVTDAQRDELLKFIQNKFEEISSK